jgi:hypothetical protein
MNDRDLTRDLGDLAATMPDHPSRAAAVHRRARQLRQRRLANRGVAAGSALALTAAAGVAVHHAATASTHIATQPTSLPDCSTIGPSTANKPSNASDPGTVGAKLNGTITALPDAHTLVLHPASTQDPSATVDDRTISLTDTTTVGTPGASPSDTLQPGTLAVGDFVTVIATDTPDGRSVADTIIIIPAGAKPTTNVGHPSSSDSADTPTSQTPAKGAGIVVGSPTESSLTIDENGTLRTFTVSPDTKYFANTDGTQCSNPNLHDGSHVGYYTNDGNHLLEVVLLP